MICEVVLPAAMSSKTGRTSREPFRFAVQAYARIPQNCPCTAVSALSVSAFPPFGYSRGFPVRFPVCLVVCAVRGTGF